MVCRHLRKALLGSAAAATLLYSYTATAQTTAPPDQAASGAVDEIIVTGRGAFLTVDTSGTTGLPIQIEKVPQSISIVTGDFIKAADLQTVGDVAQYTPGALYTGVPEGISATIKLRGFSAGAAVDGLQVQEYYDPDYATLSRLEIVEGPSSVVYGIASPGGLVNRVTKSAEAGTPTYLSGQVDSWGSYRVEGQTAQALDADGHYRAIGVAVIDGGDTFQDYLQHQGYVVYGGVDANITPTLSAFLHGGWEQHERTAFDGIPTESDGSPAPVKRSFFIGDPQDKLTTTVYNLDGDLKWRPISDLDLNLKVLYERNSTRGTAPYSFGLDSAGDIGVALQIYSPYINEDYGIGASALYHLDHFGLKDSFVSISALYQDEHVEDSEQTALFQGNYSGEANIFAGEPSIIQTLRSALVDPSQSFTNLTDTKSTTITTQSILTPIEHFSILLGASYSKVIIDNNFEGTPQNYDFPGHASYRAGATYEFLKGANAYLSYSQSFQPQGYIDVNGNILPPLTGEQYEAGVKWRSPDKRLLLTGAYYNIKQSNYAEFDEQLGGFDRYEAIGEVQHVGAEFSALGRITQNISLNAGYTYLDPKVRKDQDETIVGKSELFLPKNTASIFLTYLVAQNAHSTMNVAIGVRYVGSEETSYDGSTGPLPGYTVVDANASYEFGPWTAQINIKNLLDKKYFLNEYSTLFYGNTVGQPTTAVFTLRRRF